MQQVLIQTLFGLVYGTGVGVLEGGGLPVLCTQVVLEDVLLAEVADAHGVLRLDDGEAQVFLDEFGVVLLLREVSHVRLVALEVTLVVGSLFGHETPFD